MNAPLTINAAFPEKLQFLLKPCRYKVAYGGRGSGKCLKLGTRVLMADGSLRKVEDIVIGDAIMGPDSFPRNVLSTTRGTGQLYEIHQTSGMTYTVNEDHILSLKKSDSCKRDRGEFYGFDLHGKPIYRRPDGRYPSYSDVTNIPVKEALAQSKRWKEHFHGYKAGLIKFDEERSSINTIDPYFLGLWLGDGTSRELRLTSMDYEVINYCRDYADEHGLDFSMCTKPTTKAFDIGFIQKGTRENNLWKKFKDLNLVNDKHIPHSYLCAPEDDRLQLLAGLIDTDGYMHSNGYVFSNSNMELARQVKRLADFLGFRTGWAVRKTVGKDSANVSINGDTWRIPCKIARKKILQEDVHKNKDFLRSIVTIVPVGIGEYAGFALDGDHLFVLEDGTVTHNSWGFARALLLRGLQSPLRVLCAREYQNSISESVHKLLATQIAGMGLDRFYTVEKARIYSPVSGAEFFFEGVKNNVQRIKSYEGVDVLWATEANKITKSSWEVLIPTIRKERSEIWVDFNPELETDDTYQRFVRNVYGIAEKDLECHKINWRENPFFPEVLRREMIALRASDMDAYLNVWEGECRTVMDGAVYANELRDAMKDGRITKVPYDHATPVDTFWDLGHADHTSIWFGQYIGFEYRIIDYFEDHLRSLDHYLTTLRGRPYIYGTCWLPHDAKAKTLGSGRSIEEQVRLKGFTVRIVPRLSLTDGINAARTIFPNCWFDEKKCAEGLQCLRHYRYEVIETKENALSRVPVHDQYSHGADAFRYLGVAFKQPRKGDDSIAEMGRKLKMRLEGLRDMGSLGWMR